MPTAVQAARDTNEVHRTDFSSLAHDPLQPDLDPAGISDRALLLL